MGVQTAYDKAVLNCKNLIEANQFDAAIHLLGELRQQSPRDVRVLRMLGNALMMVDERGDAIRHLTFASKLEPQNIDVLCELAAALRRSDEMRKAHQAADQAIKLRPDHARAVTIKARLLQAHGDSERAYELIRSAMETNPDPTLLATFGQLCRELKRQSEAIDRLRDGLESHGIPRAVRQDILFVLGHLLDSIGEYDQAFTCFAKGNAMGAEASHLNLDRFLERWAKGKFEQVPRADVDGSRAVFVVGMPRSGTTLTEQIIAAHPKADGIGESDLVDAMARGRELDAFDQDYVDASGRAYLKMLGEWVPDRSVKRVCDKMPENYFFLGFIERTLPGAKIIHCTRNPIDTCLSIYFQRFGPRLAYATDLGECAEQYLAYIQVIAHFRDTLGIEMHEANYERTTREPESAIRGILEHIGLPFDEACTQFHKSKKSVHTASVSQIRQPLYTSSSERWRNYERHIGPLIEKLSPLIEG